MWIDLPEINFPSRLEIVCWASALWLFGVGCGWLLAQ